MNADITQFLIRNNLTEDMWQKAGITFEELSEIANAHKSRESELEQAASNTSALLQKHPNVHSVRWRIKHPEHLMAKIVRKRSESSEKYLSITILNYDEIITDLVGVRVLHLFKDEWFNIQEFIYDKWGISEGPVAYVRAGDNTEQYSGLCEVHNHDAGYRSIHNIISTQPCKSTIYIELQVRTIFEEGWSEIDHTIRYPNFSDNPLICRFLSIFNGLSGSADEMGSFVKLLSDQINSHQYAINEHEAEKERIELEKQEQFAKIEELANSNDELKIAVNKYKMAEKRSIEVNIGVPSSKIRASLERSFKVHEELALNTNAVENALRAQKALKFDAKTVQHALNAHEALALNAITVENALRAQKALKFDAKTVQYALNAHEALALNASTVENALRAQKTLKFDAKTVENALKAHEALTFNARTVQNALKAHEALDVSAKKRFTTKSKICTNNKKSNDSKNENE